MARACKFDDGKFGLELDQDEVDVIIKIMSCIDGLPNKSRRGICDDIRLALSQYRKNNLDDEISEDINAIYWKNYK